MLLLNLQWHNFPTVIFDETTISISATLTALPSGSVHAASQLLLSVSKQVISDIRLSRTGSKKIIKFFTVWEKKTRQVYRHRQERNCCVSICKKFAKKQKENSKRESPFDGECRPNTPIMKRERTTMKPFNFLPCKLSVSSESEECNGWEKRRKESKDEAGSEGLYCAVFASEDHVDEEWFWCQQCLVWAHTGVANYIIMTFKCGRWQ